MILQIFFIITKFLTKKIFFLKKCGHIGRTTTPDLGLGRDGLKLTKVQLDGQLIKKKFLFL